MIPSEFTYLAPQSLDEALALLDTYRDEAKLLAGGHSLIPLMKFRLASPRYLIDLGRVPELSFIREENGQIVIGAMTTHAAIEGSALLREKCPLLPAAAAEIGDVQVRNRGTIGGSLAHNDPAADYPAPILVLGTELKVVSRAGERATTPDQFFLDMLTTNLEPGEILREIRVSVDVPGTGSAYLKLHQPASGFAIVGVAARVLLDETRTFRDVRIAITGVASKAFRAAAVEEALWGRKAEAKALVAAAARSMDGIEPLSDLHASAEYRGEMARVYVRRALELAVARARPPQAVRAKPASMRARRGKPRGKKR